MAYTKIIKIQARLDRAVDYALNKEKTSLKYALDYAMNKDKNSTEETILENTINCLLSNPYKQMMQTKKAKNKKGGILGYHIIQSFTPNETTPEIAHEVGLEFARRCFSDKYQVVVSTHLDRGHLHNHIVFNSVSFVDGMKYKSEFNTYYNEIRKTNDAVCKEYNLSIISPAKDSKSITYIEWLALKQGKTTWQSLIRSDIDHAITTSYSFGEFLMDMEHLGYEIKHGKYLAFRPYGKERFSRCYKLGKRYGEDEIRARIDGEKGKHVPPVKMATYRKLLYTKALLMPNYIKQYWRWLYSLNLVKKHKAPPKVSKYLKEDLLTIERYKEQFRFLKTRNLETESEFFDYVKQVDEKISQLYSQLRSFDNAHKKNTKVYNALADIEKYKKPYELYMQGYTMMKKEHDEYLKAHKILRENGFTTPADIEALRNEKINVYEQRDGIKNEIKYHKSDKRICDNIQNSMEYIEERTRRIEQQKIVSKKKEMERKK